MFKVLYTLHIIYDIYICNIYLYVNIIYIRDAGKMSDGFSQLELIKT